MRHILVLNSKGGSGKSTIATSLAAYYASRDEKVALVDYDRQGSSLEWLERRPDNRPSITGVAGFNEASAKYRNTDVVIIDARRVPGPGLTSGPPRKTSGPVGVDIDISERARSEALRDGKGERTEVKLAVVGNRVRT